MNIPLVIRLGALLFMLYVFATSVSEDLFIDDKVKTHLSDVGEIVTSPALTEEDLDLSTNSQLEQVLGPEKMAEISASTKEMSYMERKLLGMFNAWSKTTNGQIWLDKMIKAAPAQNPNDLEYNYRDFVLDVIDINQGDGVVAQCGQTATIEHVGQQDRFSQLLGDDTQNQALQFGILGMQLGGERKIVTKDGKVYHIKLHQLSPQELPQGQIYHKRLMLRTALRCTETVNLSFKIFHTDDGRLLYSHQPGAKKQVTLTPNIPLAVLRGAVGMSYGGSRAVLMTPELQRDINGKMVNFFPSSWLLDADQTYMLEIKHIM